MSSIYLLHAANSNIARKSFRSAKVFSVIAYMIGLKLFLQVFDSVLGACFLVILQVKHFKIIRHLSEREKGGDKEALATLISSRTKHLGIFTLLIFFQLEKIPFDFIFPWNFHGFIRIWISATFSVLSDCFFSSSRGRRRKICWQNTIIFR